MTARAKRLKRKSTVRRKRDPIPWKYCFLTMICGLFLVAGFFYAARQHFSSMSMGMENAELRKEIKKLETVQRNFKLKKEIALSPGEIKKAAKELGLQAMTARNIEIPQPKETTAKNAENKEQPKSDKAKDSKPTKKDKDKNSKDKKKGKKKEPKNQKDKNKSEPKRKSKVGK